MADIERLNKVGQRLEKWCSVCDEVRGHTVASVNVRGHATRVNCPICGTRGPFKNGNRSSAKIIAATEVQRLQLDAPPSCKAADQSPILWLR